MEVDASLRMALRSSARRKNIEIERPPCARASRKDVARMEFDAASSTFLLQPTTYWKMNFSNQEIEVVPLEDWQFSRKFVPIFRNK